MSDGWPCEHAEDLLCPDGCRCMCRTCFKRRRSPLANEIGRAVFGPGGPLAAPDIACCAVCGVPGEHFDPTGDGLAEFWSHNIHPEDGHNFAVRAALASPGEES